MSFAMGWVVRWVPIVVFVVLIRLEARTPDLTFVPGEANDLLVRKLGHAAVYGLLALLAWWALRSDDQSADVARPGRLRAWLAFARAWILPLLITATVAVADELWQNSSVGREGKLTDVLTDLTGAVAALVLLRTWRHRRWIRSGRPARATADLSPSARGSPPAG
jgi:VanZ family protein